jgi:hypothetical protein
MNVQNFARRTELTEQLALLLFVPEDPNINTLLKNHQPIPGILSNGKHVSEWEM